jgi:NAD(P)-dependent dehydrogenase (short-subunit alcohol dehydrogenase family)
MRSSQTGAGRSRPLAGRSVVVTGADGAVGEGLATAIAEAGGAVALVGAGDSCRLLASDLRQRGADAVAVESSLRTLARAGGADSVFAEAKRILGPATGLVHAALAPLALRSGALVDVDEATWESIWELTMRSTLRCFQAAYRSFAGRGGRIVVVTSTVSMTGAAGLVPLAAASEAQRLLAKSAARQWGPAGVTVNCLATDIAALERHGPGQPGDGAEGGLGPTGGRLALSPPALGHAGDPREDLAPIAVFLLAEPSHFLTGSTLCVDGGLVMAP